VITASDDGSGDYEEWWTELSPSWSSSGLNSAADTFEPFGEEEAACRQWESELSISCVPQRISRGLLCQIRWQACRGWQGKTMQVCRAYRAGDLSFTALNQCSGDLNQQKWESKHCVRCSCCAKQQKLCVLPGSVFCALGNCWQLRAEGCRLAVEILPCEGWNSLGML